jgi:small-conductance mechanosensitive channel
MILRHRSPCRPVERASAWSVLVSLMLFATAAGANDEPAMPEWVDQVGDGLAAVAGPWIAQEVFLGVRWMTLGAAAIVLVLVASVDAVLRWVVRVKVRRDERDRETPQPTREFRHWLDRGLQAAIPPLALLLWVHGVYAALSVVLLDLRFPDVAGAALAALEFSRGVGTLGGLYWLLYRLGGVLEARLSRGTAADSPWDRVFLPLAGKSARLTLPLIALIFGVPALDVTPGLQQLFQNGVSLVLIGTVAYILFQLVAATEDLLLSRFRIDVSDNLQARRVYTQVTVLKKVAIVVIGIFTLASMLMVFDSVRQFGTSLLASAGIAGVIIGFAAQRSIATLLAGFQIAITQPIRIDDVVIVENEWGRIEDITLTYVVVCIWDLRRLVLPITYFIERPFQNWTRTSADILGTVFLHVDYTMPLEPLRQELDRALRASKHWDGKVNGLVVTDVRERTLEVRALMSASSAGAAWDLRCEIREKLVEFVRKNHPECLPRLRAELKPLAQGAVPAA